MPRIAPVPVADISETIRARLAAGMAAGVYDNKTDEPPLSMRILAWSSWAFTATDALMRPLWEPGLLEPRLIELLRLRSAQVNGCASCAGYVKIDTVSDDDAACMVDLDTSALSAREKAAVRFCSKFAGNHYAVDDDDFTRLLEHFSEAEVVELSLFVSVMSGLHRFMSLCQVTSDRAPLIGYRRELVDAPLSSDAHA